MLGVSVTTLYAYVSRKGIRSQAIPRERARRYWRADIERLRESGGEKIKALNGTPPTSQVTLVTKSGRFYRGHDSIELSMRATFEETIAILWEMDVSEIPASVSKRPAQFKALYPTLAGMSATDRAAVLFPFLEQSDPRSHDLTPAGMRRTGMEVLRWYAAILVGRQQATAAPIHEVIGSAFRLSSEWEDVVRRLLVLGADSGVEFITTAVRAAASAGVTPWRSVLTGLFAITGRWSKFGRIDSLGRMLNEIAQDADPRQPIIRRVREGDTLPGFAAALYPDGDPRTRVLLEQLQSMLGKDAGLARLNAAIDTAREVRRMGPNFALINYYISRRIGSNPADSLFPLSRAAGWIAHSIEQCAVGEALYDEGRRDLVLYAGPLPA
jgi:citrate synthase